MVVAYNLGLCILLFDSIIDITYSKFLTDRNECSKSFVVGIDSINTVCGGRFIIVGLAKYFFNCFLDFNSPASTFLFVNSVSIGY